MSVLAVDHFATLFDEQFTHTNTTRLQRARVWEYVQGILPSDPDHSCRILELNCNTGEDALYFTRLGHEVIATDISGSMLRVAQKKAEASKFPEKPEFRLSKLNKLGKDASSQRFDLVFSNFGGLNYFSPEEIQLLCTRMSEMLKPDGRMVFVLKNKKGIWDHLSSGGVGSKDKHPLAQAAEHSGKQLWYYKPDEIIRLFALCFDKVHQQAIGLTLPPVHQEEKMGGKRRLLNRLKRWENKLGQLPSLASIGDHYLIDLKRR
ncbi:MAG: class I SAM-dependent methyltransferase [Bacteroidota bacterium]